MSEQIASPAGGACPVEVTFELSGHGWADLTLRVGAGAYEVSGASYLTDALGDLLRFAVVIASGGHVAECTFHLEPEESRLVAWRDAEMVNLYAYEFPSAGARAPIEDGVERFRARCMAEDLAQAIERAAGQVLARHGLPGYRAAWQLEFPSRALAALRAALALPPPDMSFGLTP